MTAKICPRGTKKVGCPVGMTRDPETSKCTRNIYRRSDVLLQTVVKEPKFKHKYKYAGWMTPGGDTHVYHKDWGDIPFNAMDEKIGYTIMDHEGELYKFESWDPKNWDKISDGQIKSKMRTYLNNIDKKVIQLKRRNITIEGK